MALLPAMIVLWIVVLVASPYCLAMPLLCACYASTAGPYLVGADGELTASHDGAGLAVAEMDLATWPRARYAWNSDTVVDTRRAHWFQRRPELFDALAAPVSVGHPLETGAMDKQGADATSAPVTDKRGQA